MSSDLEVGGVVIDTISRENGEKFEYRKNPTVHTHAIKIQATEQKQAGLSRSPVRQPRPCCQSNQLQCAFIDPAFLVCNSQGSERELEEEGVRLREERGSAGHG